jgi:hypothetical protein
MGHVRRVGFHAKYLDEFLRLAPLEGVNLVELKPGHFRRHGVELYTYNDGVWAINRDVAAKIRDVAGEHDIQVQLHLPYEDAIDATKEEGLCQAIKANHPVILDRYKVLSDLHDEFDIGRVITTHPPAYLIRGEQVADMVTASEHGRQLYFELDTLIKERGMQFRLGIENVPDPKIGNACLGYEMRQLKDLVGYTEEIGFTVDAGHRLLSENMSVTQMFALRPVVNIHFHSNPGVPSEMGWDDDAHQMATTANLRTFHKYVQSIRANKIPVICEVAHLDQIDNGMLVGYVANLRQRLS